MDPGEQRRKNPEVTENDRQQQENDTPSWQPMNYTVAETSMLRFEGYKAARQGKDGRTGESRGPKAGGNNKEAVIGRTEGIGSRTQRSLVALK